MILCLGSSDSHATMLDSRMATDKANWADAPLVVDSVTEQPLLKRKVAGLIPALGSQFDGEVDG